MTQVGAIIGGVLVGNLTQSVVATPHKLIAPKALAKMRELSKGLTQDEFNSVEKAIEETMNYHPELVQKGVSIVRATKDNSKEISHIVEKELDNNLIMKYLPKEAKKY